MNKVAACEKLFRGLRKRKNGCWEWQGAKSGGYGYIVLNKRTWLTHRLAWKLFRGSFTGLWVCHECDNPSCCNPDHLFLGTSEDNTADRHAKGRTAQGEDCGNAKLSNQQVAEIRQQYDGEFGTAKKLARKYRISIWQIRNILQGRQRMDGITEVAWVPWRDHAQKLTDEQVARLRTRYDGGLGCAQRLAKEYGVSYDQVRNLILGKQRMKGITQITWHPWVRHDHNPKRLKQNQNSQPKEINQ